MSSRGQVNSLSMFPPNTFSKQHDVVNQVVLILSTRTFFRPIRGGLRSEHRTVHRGDRGLSSPLDWAISVIPHCLCLSEDILNAVESRTFGAPPIAGNLDI